jgi:hypothetical protein
VKDHVSVRQSVTHPLVVEQVSSQLDHTGLGRLRKAVDADYLAAPSEFPHQRSADEPRRASDNRPH